MSPLSASSSFSLRQSLLEIARRDVGKLEDTNNKAAWIAKLWPATNFPDGMDQEQPYCAAGQCYCMREWLKLPDVRTALGFTPAQAEAWRCQNAAVVDVIKWAKRKGLTVLPRNCILHAGDLVVYRWNSGGRHIELVTDDDNTTKGPFRAIGYNTNESGARDGEGCFEKPRSRDNVECFIRLMP